jgi:hypothetical protein
MMSEQPSSRDGPVPVSPPLMRRADIASSCLECRYPPPETTPLPPPRKSSLLCQLIRPNNRRNAAS